MKSTLFLVNIVLTTKVKKLQEEIETLRTKLKGYESGDGLKFLGFNNTVVKQKRKRKKKDEVSRKYFCKIGECGKSYGTENSLNQHMKLKHIDFWNKIKEKEKSLIKPKTGESSVQSKGKEGEKNSEGTQESNIPKLKLEIKEEEKASK
jgi:hypothetical protein